MAVLDDSLYIVVFTSIITITGDIYSVELSLVTPMF